MSSCTQCLQRICRKHPLQDHGEREQKLQDKVAEMNSKVLEKAYKELEAFNKSKQLERDLSLEADNYKTAMEFERMKATLQKPKKRSFEEAKLSQNSSLNPSVIATMLHDSDSSANATTSSSSEDSDDGNIVKVFIKRGGETRFVERTRTDEIVRALEIEKEIETGTGTVIAALINDLIRMVKKIENIVIVIVIAALREDKLVMILVVILKVPVTTSVTNVVMIIKTENVIGNEAAPRNKIILDTVVAIIKLQYVCGILRV